MIDLVVYPNQVQCICSLFLCQHKASYGHIEKGTLNVRNASIDYGQVCRGIFLNTD